MVVLQQTVVAVFLVLLTLCVQSAGVSVLIRWLRPVVASGIHKLNMLSSSVLVMQATIAILILQGLVIVLWAGCYRWLCFSSWNSSFYFSASTYSTVGYGDIVLPAKWHLMGPLESLMGVLMCGISVALLFALIYRLIESEFAGLDVNPADHRSKVAAGAGR